MVETGVSVVFPEVDAEGFFGVLPRVSAVNSESGWFVGGVVGGIGIKVFKVDFAFATPALEVRIFINARESKNV
jgi:hypothetical protein